MFADKDSEVTLHSYGKEHYEYNEEFNYYWVKGTGLAANSTLKKPPIYEEGFIPIFTDGDWVVVENNFGKTSYSTRAKTPTVVDYYGEIKVGYTLLEPKNFDSWNGEVWLDQRTEQEKYDTYLSTFQSLTRRQFKLVLLENDLLGTVESSISSIVDDKQRALIQIEYTESTEFVRTSDSVKFMYNILNLTEDQINTMWEQALTL